MEQVSIKKNVFFNGLYTILNIIFPLITFPYVTRCLFVDDLGMVTFYTSIANYAMLLGALGISTYGIRKVAQARESKNCLTKTVQELFLLNCFFTLIVISLLLGISIFVPKLRTDVNLLIINCIYVFLAPFGLDWAYAGLEQYKYIAVRSCVVKIISLVLVFLFVHDSSDYINYAVITVFSSVFSWIINFIHIRKLIGILHPIHTLEFKNHIKPMLYLFASLLAVNIYTNVDTIMLGFISGDKQVGYYAVAVKVKTVLLSMINAISTVLLPRMSFYLHNNELKQYRETLKKAICIIAWIAIPCVTFFEITALETVTILGGVGYEKSSICMMILMPILLISGLSNITGNQILIPSGNDKGFMVAVSCGAIVNIVFNVVFMKYWHAAGAAVATLVAEFVQMSVQIYYSRQHLKNNIDFLYIIKLLFAAIVTCVIVNLMFTFGVTIDNVFILFISKAILFAMVYFIFLIIGKDFMLKEIYKQIYTSYKRNKDKRIK